MAGNLNLKNSSVYFSQDLGENEKARCSGGKGRISIVRSGRGLGKILKGKNKGAEPINSDNEKEGNGEMMEKGKLEENVGL